MRNPKQVNLSNAENSLKSHSGQLKSLRRTLRPIALVQFPGKSQNQYLSVNPLLTRALGVFCTSKQVNTVDCSTSVKSIAQWRVPQNRTNRLHFLCQAHIIKLFFEQLIKGSLLQHINYFFTCATFAIRVFYRRQLRLEVSRV